MFLTNEFLAFWKVVNILFQEVFGTSCFFAIDDVRFLRWLNLGENGRWFLWNEEIEWEMNDCCQQLAERKEYYKRRRVKWTAVLSWGKTKNGVSSQLLLRDFKGVLLSWKVNTYDRRWTGWIESSGEWLGAKLADRFMYKSKTFSDVTFVNTKPWKTWKITISQRWENEYSLWHRF